MSYKVDDLPDDYLPKLDELAGDLRVLAEVVGVRMALRIAELFGGTPATFYGHKKWLIRWRDALIRKEYDQGKISVVALARKSGICERHAYNILGQQPGEDKQLKLF